jgi:hypothetical protein
MLHGECKRSLASDQVVARIQEGKIGGVTMMARKVESHRRLFDSRGITVSLRTPHRINENDDAADEIEVYR